MTSHPHANRSVSWPSLARVEGGSHPQAVLLLAHGAGAGMDHPVMAQLAKSIASEALAVVRFEFDYMVAQRSSGKRRPPDRLEALQRCYERWILATQAHYPKIPVFLAGKSLGGRVACVCLAHADQQVKGAIAIGYPFHPVGKTESQHWRWAPLQQQQRPVLILQGSRDPFGNAAQLAAWPLPEQVQLHWFEQGDHSLQPTKRSGATQLQYLQQAGALIQQHCARYNTPDFPI
ncbi:MAG: alpha/beta family hydrolase [Ferrimonas sp.]